MDHARRPVPHMAPGLGSTVDSSPARPGISSANRGRAERIRRMPVSPDRAASWERTDDTKIRPSLGPRTSSRVRTQQDTTRANQYATADRPLDRRRPTSQVTKSLESRDVVRSLHVRSAVAGRGRLPLIASPSCYRGQVDHPVIISTFYLPEITGTVRYQCVLSRSICAG